MANSDISGQITDGSGNGVANAEVYLWREDLAGAGGVVASTTADSSGNFAFTAHPDGSGSSESWHVAAEDPTASVQLQSAYGVTASPPTSVNSQFDVSITGTSPSPVVQGETLAVDASLSNSGTDSDTQTITLDVDNGVGQVDSSLEAAQGGASESTTLSWSVPSGQTEQDYQATVSSADDSASQTVTVASAVPASLVSHWTFDSADTNSGTAIDTVGSNDGTIQGATTGVSGANQTYTTNEAYDFDGSGNYVNTGYVPSSQTFSVACWFNADSISSRGYLFANPSASGDLNHNSGFGFMVGSGNLRVLSGNGSTFNVDSFASISTGVWYHAVLTYNNGWTAYLDGSSVGTSNIGYAVTDVAAYIGEASNYGDNFDGTIDDPRYYNKELTSTEVSNLYNNGRITDSSAFFDTTITSTPSLVEPGNTLEVTADITNNGNDQETQAVTLDIDNGVGQVDSQTVTLSSGESVTKTLSWSVPSGQTKQDYQAAVASADDSASQTVTVASAVPASLVSHWTFDTADTNSGTAVDVVGSNNGTINGATTGVSGANQTYTTNEAYEFVDAGDEVVVSDDSTLKPGSGDFSVAAWFKTPGVVGKRNIIVIKRRSGSDPRKGWDIALDSGNMRYIAEDSNNNKNKNIGSAAADDQWHHGVLVRDEDTVTGYLDGSQDVSQTSTLNDVDTSRDLRIGQTDPSDGSSPDAFTGEIDDVRYYSKALTSTEVSNLYNNGRI